MDENNEKLLIREKMTLQPILLPLLWWHNRRLPPYSSTMQAKTAIALLSYVQTGNPIQPPRAQFPDRANQPVQCLQIPRRRRQVYTRLRPERAVPNGREEAKCCKVHCIHNLIFPPFFNVSLCDGQANIDCMSVHAPRTHHHHHHQPSSALVPLDFSTCDMCQELTRLCNVYRRALSPQSSESDCQP